MMNENDATLTGERYNLPKVLEKTSQGNSALAGFYMFHMICVLPSSKITILWIMIIATAFFLA